MRRRNFLAGAIAALFTYITLAAFVPRPLGWHHRYHHYYEDRYHNDQNDQDDDQRKNDRSDSTTY